MNAQVPEQASTLDLVPLLGLPRGARVLALGAERLAADLVEDGVRVLGERAWSYGGGARVLVAGPDSWEPALRCLRAAAPPTAVVLLAHDARALRPRVRAVRRSGWRDVRVLALDDASTPTRAATLDGPALRILVQRLQQPLTTRQVLRGALDRQLAATPLRGSVLRARLAVARRD